jgi:hypothetical protein
MSFLSLNLLVTLLRLAKGLIDWLIAFVIVLSVPRAVKS